MFSGLDILPLEGARGPMHLPGQVDILDRPADPDCEAGAQLWSLHQGSQTPGRITAALGDFQLKSAREGGYAAIPLGQSLGSAGRGAGILVRADRSCLVFRTVDRKAWGRGPEPHRMIEFLPIVLRLPPLLPYGDACAVEPALCLSAGKPCIRFTAIARTDDPVSPDDATEIERALGAQLCWEATAWGNILDELSPIDPQGTWPAAFPRCDISPGDLKRFEAHARRAARFVLDQEQYLLRGLALRVISGRRLQGGVAPARLSLRLDAEGPHVVPAQEHDRIMRRLSRLLFRGEFSADRLTAQEIRPGKNGAAGLDRISLINLSLTGPASNHERLELLAEFGDQEG